MTKQDRPLVKKKRRRTKTKQFQVNLVLSLQTLCCMNLPEQDIEFIKGYSKCFLIDIKQRFLREIYAYPMPLSYNCNNFWFTFETRDNDETMYNDETSTSLVANTIKK